MGLTLTESLYRRLISWSNSQLKRSAKSAVVLHQRDQCTEGALFKSMSSKSIDPNTTVEETEFICPNDYFCKGTEPFAGSLVQSRF